MENDYQLATARSIELQEPSHNCRHRSNSPKTTNHLITQKMLAHLAFIEVEFARNMEWQKQLVTQICHYSNSQTGGKQATQANSLSFNLDQQRQLRLILSSILGEDQAVGNIKQMLRAAAEHIHSRVRESPAFSFSPISKFSQEKLQFPAVPRVITLNDLAPSTQREISATPPSLPPRTPKSKPQNTKNIHNRAKALTFTPKQSDNEEKSETPIERNAKSLEKSQVCKGYRQLELQDSLGKRLFKDVQDKIIYIEDYSEKESIGSQVSLNLSISNQAKQPEDEDLERPSPKNHTIKFSLKSGNFEHQSIYLPEKNSLQIGQKVWNPERIDEERVKIDGLAFREFPRRKIGKQSPKHESVFSYQQISKGKVRKMHDSFGEAYQEYYLQEGRYEGKEGSIYRYTNSKYQQL